MPIGIIVPIQDMLIHTWTLSLLKCKFFNILRMDKIIIIWPT